MSLLNTLEKLTEIAHKNNILLTEEGGELKALELVLNYMPKESRAEFMADTFVMLQDEIDALYEASRELTDEEYGYEEAQEDMNEYRRSIA